MFKFLMSPVFNVVCGVVTLISAFFAIYTWQAAKPVQEISWASGSRILLHENQWGIAALIAKNEYSPNIMESMVILKNTGTVVLSKENMRPPIVTLKFDGAIINHQADFGQAVTNPIVQINQNVATVSFEAFDPGATAKLQVVWFGSKLQPDNTYVAAQGLGAESITKKMTRTSNFGFFETFITYLMLLWVAAFILLALLTAVIKLGMLPGLTEFIPPSWSYLMKSAGFIFIPLLVILNLVELFSAGPVSEVGKFATEWNAKSFP